MVVDICGAVYNKIREWQNEMKQTWKKMSLPVKLIPLYHLIKKDDGCLSDSLVVHYFGLMATKMKIISVSIPWM